LLSVNRVIFILFFQIIFPASIFFTLFLQFIYKIYIDKHILHLYNIGKDKQLTKEIKMKQIKLQQASTGIMAQFMDEDEQPDAEITELFGTHILPTPYVNNMKHALAEVTRLNPNHYISIIKEV
jgi:hypothetical protein